MTRLDSVPCVVVGGRLNGLGVLRSLRAGRMPLVVVDSAWWAPAMWSRSCRKVRSHRLDGAPLVQCLVNVANCFDSKPVLLLTDEMAVYTVSEQRDELLSFYRFSLPAPGTVRVLTEKHLFHQLAEAHGFPVPRAMVVESGTELTALRELRFPVIIKITDKRIVHSGRVPSVVRVETYLSAREIARRLVGIANRLIVQEEIPGPDSNICFCLFYRAGRGRPITMFTGRKIRCRPSRTGSTSICIAAPEVSTELEALTERLIDEVGFFGIGSIEYKWHPEEKRFLIVEPTVGRTDWQEEIATLCGTNIPLAAYCNEAGLSLNPAASGARQVAWRETIGCGWPRNVCGRPMRMYDGYWRIDDPLPAVAYYGGAWLMRMRSSAGDRGLPPTNAEAGLNPGKPVSA
jgi:D-aspartate ligase